MNRVWELISGAMGSWHDGKLFVERTVAINHDALHVIVGMLVWIAAGLVTRRPLISIRPWLWVLAVIGWNEAVDLWVERWPDPATQYGEGAKDLLLTMFVPTVLLLALRFAPSLFKTGRSAKR